MSAAGEGRHFLVVARMSPPGTNLPNSAVQQFRQLSEDQLTVIGRRRDRRSLTQTCPPKPTDGQQLADHKSGHAVCRAYIANFRKLWRLVTRLPQKDCLSRGGDERKLSEDGTSTETK
jgi:hypothetical protein